MNGSESPAFVHVRLVPSVPRTCPLMPPDAASLVLLTPPVAIPRGVAVVPSP